MSSPSLYSRREEAINIGSHLLAALLAGIGTLFLFLKALDFELVYLVSSTIFGLSMVVLFVASTIYHAASDPGRRASLRVFDHCAIFILIAGTYTPFALLVLQGAIGWWIFSISWGLAAIGILLKLKYTGRFKILSTSIYVFMGWIIVFAGKTLLENISSGGFFWLAAGGLFYTVGAVIYSFKKIQYTHAIFHVFVVAGSACHFISVYQHILSQG